MPTAISIVLKDDEVPDHASGFSFLQRNCMRCKNDMTLRWRYADAPVDTGLDSDSFSYKTCYINIYQGIKLVGSATGMILTVSTRHGKTALAPFELIDQCDSASPELRDFSHAATQALFSQQARELFYPGEVLFSFTGITILHSVYEQDTWRECLEALRNLHIGGVVDHPYPPVIAESVLKAKQESLPLPQSLCRMKHAKICANQRPRLSACLTQHVVASSAVDAWLELER